ncbi:MAG: class I SAM-dependent methyltransferase [Lentisphaeria bacterium]|nr:class I SAM-dependent methyltransferase [Lentisphaeria bacterium]
MCPDPETKPIHLDDFIIDYWIPGVPGWLGHTYFAGLLMKEFRPRVFVELGTHYGNSYFAFCQSAKKYGVDVCCYAVDSWKGEAQAGEYGEEVYRAVSDYNDRNYSTFSTLLRGMFDDYAGRFEDGTIDLLHIDGFHSYEACRHDFETWVGKVRPGGIVLFHDIAVRQDGFGVCAFWDEVRKQTAESFAFNHSNGLGVWRKPGGPELESPVLRGLFRPDWEIVAAVVNKALETSTVLNAIDKSLCFRELEQKNSQLEQAYWMSELSFSMLFGRAVLLSLKLLLGSPLILLVPLCLLKPFRTGFVKKLLNRYRTWFDAWIRTSLRILYRLSPAAVQRFLSGTYAPSLRDSPEPVIPDERIIKETPGK